MMRTNPGEKVWTVVMEVAAPENFTQQEVERCIEDAIDRRFSGSISAIKIVETIDAPYGPAGVSVKIEK
jgi:hypothetical protein